MLGVPLPAPPARALRRAHPPRLLAGLAPPIMAALHPPIKATVEVRAAGEVYNGDLRATPWH